MLVSLFLLKFVGPPPPAFPLRVALVVIMLAVVAIAHAMSVGSIVPVALNVTVGLILLGWYAGE
jgi:hypothetical protein